MANDTNSVLVDTRARQPSNRNMSAVATATAHTFRTRLDEEINTRVSTIGTTRTTQPIRPIVDTTTGHKQIVNDGAMINNQHNNKPPATTPLYERLFATPPDRRHEPTVNRSDLPDTSGTLRRIKSFADTIRGPAAIAALEIGTSTNTIIAFAGLETGWGQHLPATTSTSSNNLFGIKAHNRHQSVTNTTSEYIDGRMQQVEQQFRSYQSVTESIADFSRFLRTNPRYDEALQHANDPKQFIKLVHKAGYATDPDYANKVISALQQLENITTQSGAIGIGWK